MSDLQNLQKEVKQAADPLRAIAVARFFKTGKGDYGEGDIFVGPTVPQARVIALQYKELSLANITQLLHSKIHEERLIALLVLVDKSKKGNEQRKKEIYDLYLANTRFINNWDLIDLSAEYIVGGFLLNKPITILKKLAVSESIWERRIAIMSTFQFIKVGEYEQTFEIAEILLYDKHDLIQKAVGWMLREVGKRCSLEAEEKFLKSRYKAMPRTMLRYAIERFSEDKRQRYLAGLA